MARKPRKIAPSPDRPLLQWAAAAFGALVTLAIIGVVLWEAVQPPNPPILSARIVDVIPAKSGFVAEVKVVNDGLNTAGAVNISGFLNDQTSTATVDYVPGHGHATAYLLFRSDPRAAVVRVEGWSEP